MGLSKSTMVQVAPGDRPSSEFLNTVYQDRFFSIDEKTLLQQVKDQFGPELERLKNVPPADIGSPSIRTKDLTDHGLDPSKELYGKGFDEVNRTLVGVLALRWIWNDNYEHFVRGQQKDLQLRRTSFAWLRNYFKSNLRPQEDLLPLVISMIINDVGKDPALASDYLDQTGDKLCDQNHDSLLYEAAKANILPCLDLLSLKQKNDLLLGLELGSELNAGQLAQAESVPISLEFLYSMKGKEHAFELKFMEQILDVAGSLGHKYPYGAKSLIQPVFEAFQTVHDISRDIILGKFTLREGYDEVLRRRGSLLEKTGFRHLNVSNPEERALLRLLTMGRTVDTHQAELFRQAFEGLEGDKKEQLVVGLNIDGNANETAVLPYYMPAVLSDVLETMKDSTEREKRRALTSVMRYLARVLDESSVSQNSPKSPVSNHPDPTAKVEDVPEVPGIVIEHNMLKAREVVGDPDFKKNPGKLDDLELPPAQPLIRRRTSQSI